MTSGKLHARALGLFSRFVSVPADGQEAPSFLQRRLGIYLTIVLCLWITAFAVEQIASVLDGRWDSQCPRYGLDA
jgi:hypothetical protein